MNHEYYCGCEGRNVRDCRCMRGYQLPRRLRDLIDHRAAFFFVGMACGGAIMFSIVWP